MVSCTRHYMRSIASDACRLSKSGSRKEENRSSGSLPTFESARSMSPRSLVGTLTCCRSLTPTLQRQCWSQPGLARWRNVTQTFDVFEADRCGSAANGNGWETSTMQRRTTSHFAGASALLDRGIRDQLRLSWRLLRDERVSALKFALPAFLALYVVSPIDPIPDFLLGLGQVDDIGIVIAGVLLLARIIPRLAPGHVVDEHLRDMGLDHQTAKTSAKPGEVLDARFNVRG